MDVGLNLCADMLLDKTTIEYMRDKEIAVLFYSSLCNVTWVFNPSVFPEDEQIIRKLKGQKLQKWSSSWRGAGGCIADIRNRHYNTKEDYMDYYCSGNEGIVYPLVKECLGNLGWEPIFD